MTPSIHHRAIAGTLCGDIEKSGQKKVSVYTTASVMLQQTALLQKICDLIPFNAQAAAPGVPAVLVVNPAEAFSTIRKT
jgi:hypothetical protein